MKRFFFCLLACGLIAPATSFASVSPMLVKASTPAVYYKAADGKRYVFPNEATYKSWYADFSSVTTISDTELASLPIGGNVTMRPGVSLVKITTDPKVYAIDAGGTLRWITSEEIARSLYGTNWARLVKDVPDALFTDYRMGTSINQATAFVPATVTQAATTIDIDQQHLPEPLPPANPTPAPAPAPAPTPATTSTSPTPAAYSVTLNTTKESVRLNEAYTIQAIALPRASIAQVKLFLNTQLVSSCESSPCSLDTRVPTSNTPDAYTVRAEVTWNDGHTMTATKTLAVRQESAYVNLNIETPEVRPHGTRVVSVDIDPAFLAYSIDIYMDGGVAKGCNSTQHCAWSEIENSAVSTTHTFYAVASDRNGIRATSGSSTVAVVMNDHPLVSVLGGKTTIYPGENVDMTATATDSDGVQSIRLYANGTLIKTCAAARCSSDTGPWMTPGIVTLSADATDAQGLTSARTDTTVSVVAR